MTDKRTLRSISVADFGRIADEFATKDAWQLLQMIFEIHALRAERDALRKVDDAMVERACIARVGAYNWQGSGESEREAMRKVLTAALAVQPMTGDKHE